MGRSVIGILTVARYLQEGVGDGVRCFVDTDKGLQQVDSFVGFAGKLQAYLVYENLYWIHMFPQPRVTVRLDSEVFLAKYNLTGLTRSDVLTYAERAASTAALTPVTANTVQTVGCGFEVGDSATNVLNAVGSDDTPNSAWIG
jgi:hypothetical protein